MAKVRVEILMDVSEESIKNIQKLEGEIISLLDSHLEVNAVENIQTSAEQSLFIPNDKIRYIGNANGITVYAEGLTGGSVAWIKDNATGLVRKAELRATIKKSLHLDEYKKAVSKVTSWASDDVSCEFVTLDDVVYAFFNYRK